MKLTDNLHEFLKMSDYILSIAANEFTEAVQQVRLFEIIQPINSKKIHEFHTNSKKTNLGKFSGNSLYVKFSENMPVKNTIKTFKIQ
jgi:hypothetical protein